MKKRTKKNLNIFALLIIKVHRLEITQQAGSVNIYLSEK